MSVKITVRLTAGADSDEGTSGRYPTATCSGAHSSLSGQFLSLVGYESFVLQSALPKLNVMPASDLLAKLPSMHACHNGNTHS